MVRFRPHPHQRPRVRRGDKVTHLLEGWSGVVETVTAEEIYVLWFGHKAGWAVRDDLKNV